MRDSLIGKRVTYGDYTGVIVSVGSDRIPKMKVDSDFQSECDLKELPCHNHSLYVDITDFSELVFHKPHYDPIGMLLKLLELCLQSKKVGVDAFYEYSPLINGVEIRVNEDGWDYMRDSSGNILVDDEGEELIKDKDFKSEFNIENMDAIMEAISYMENLIARKAAANGEKDT